MPVEAHRAGLRVVVALHQVRHRRLACTGRTDEGDLDPDLAEEEGSSLDDWSEPREPWFKRSMPAIALGMLAFFLGATLVQVLFAR